MQEYYDVCVIGGGAAGMSAAIAAAEGGCNVCILEKNKKLGKKLYATGNGRCNLANQDDTWEHYHSSSDRAMMEQFLKQSIGEHPNQELFAFLKQVGIYTQCVNGYYYPGSMQASAVVWALLDKLKSLHVTMQTSCSVTKIEKTADGFHVFGENTDMLSAKKVILAAGGCSYSSLGGSTYGYTLAQKSGLALTERKPALCGMCTRECLEEVKGVRVPCTAWIDTDTDKKTQTGELQFTEYGLSGIMIFNLASSVGKMLGKEKDVPIGIDFMSRIPMDEFLQVEGLDRSIYGYLNAFLPDKLALYLLEKSGISPKQPLSGLEEETLRKLYLLCRHCSFHVKALKDFESAQVTAGGIRLDMIQPDTLETKLPGLYAVGELLDIDGDCGGYNLTFAILTGRKAGRSCHA